MSTVLFRNVPISRAGVAQEQAWKFDRATLRRLGLDARRWIRVAQLPDELIRLAPTYANAPLWLSHSKKSRLVVGHVHRPRSNGVDLFADLEVDEWAADAVAQGVLPRELSIGMDCRLHVEWSPGAIDGEEYDCAYRDLAGGHVALVRRGWAGPAYCLPL